jgi:ElaB/YqjD/DUF883 family membrane-anchored ribosome-binding protein
MTKQRADYPLDYTTGPTDNGPHDGSAKEQLKDAAAQAQEYAGKVADQAREYGEKAQAAAKEFKPFVEKSLKEQPMTTLASAAVIGFVLGALWKK